MKKKSSYLRMFSLFLILTASLNPLLGLAEEAPVTGQEIKTSEVLDTTEPDRSETSADTTVSELMTSEEEVTSQAEEQTTNEDSEALQTETEEQLEATKQLPIYRLYNYENGEHLYTIDANEKNVLYQKHNWGYEGIAWYAPNSGQPVYRLYQPGLQNHLYTMDKNEVRVLTSQHGWKSDNNGRPVFYSGGKVPIYRLYNRSLRGLHHWTTDRNEYNVLPRYGWQQEGIKFYATRLGKPIKTQYAQKILYNGTYYRVRGKHGYVILVNKKHPVSASYHPGENPAAKAAFNRLTNQMRNLGFGISYSYSGFRSYSTQSSLYWNYVRQYGQAAADRFSARPGYSEHQTGLAFDIMDTGGGLLSQPSDVSWLANHAHEYGFIVRYRPGKESITGYMEEAWHIRYIGPEAADIYRSGLTLEEYFGVPGGGYKN